MYFPGSVAPLPRSILPREMGIDRIDDIDDLLDGGRMVSLDVLGLTIGFGFGDDGVNPRVGGDFHCREKSPVVLLGGGVFGYS